MQNLRWKLITIVAVLVIFAAVGVYPIVAAHYGITSPGWLMDKQLKLGLDLKGGVHLVLRVQTDTALRVQTDGEAERLREELQKRNIPIKSINSISPTQFGVAEPQIAQQGAAGDEILVQLPGVTDVEAAKGVIQTTGMLELKIVEQGPAPTKEALMTNGQVPPGMEIVPGATGVPGEPAG